LCCSGEKEIKNGNTVFVGLLDTSAQQLTGEFRDHVTIMAAVAAAGDKIPPWFLVPKSGEVSEDQLVGEFEGSEIIYTDTGYQTQETFCQWLLHFNK